MSTRARGQNSRTFKESITVARGESAMHPDRVTANALLGQQAAACTTPGTEHHPQNPKKKARKRGGDDGDDGDGDRVGGDARDKYKHPKKSDRERQHMVRRGWQGRLYNRL